MYAVTAVPNTLIKQFVNSKMKNAIIVFLNAFKVRIVDAFKMRISVCIKNAKFAHKKSYRTVCLRSLDSLCAVSYYMYKILLL